MREAVREYLTGERWRISQEDVGVRGAASPSCSSSKLKFDNFKLTQCTAAEVTSRLTQWESGGHLDCQQESGFERPVCP